MKFVLLLALSISAAAHAEIRYPTYIKKSPHSLRELKRYIEEIHKSGVVQKDVERRVYSRLGLSEVDELALIELKDLYPVSIPRANCFDSDELAKAAEQIREVFSFLADLYVANLGQDSIFYPVEKVEVCERDDDHVPFDVPFFYDLETHVLTIAPKDRYGLGLKILDRRSILRKWKLGRHYEVYLSEYMDEIDDLDGKQQKTEEVLLGKYFFGMKLIWRAINPLSPLRRAISKLVRAKRSSSLSGFHATMAANPQARVRDFMAELIVRDSNRDLFDDSDHLKFWNLSQDELTILEANYLGATKSPFLFLSLIRDAASHVGCQVSKSIKTDIGVSSSAWISIANAHNIRVSLCTGGPLEKYYESGEANPAQEEKIKVDSEGKFLSVATVDNVNISAGLSLRWASPDALYIAAMRQALNGIIRNMERIRKLRKP